MKIIPETAEDIATIIGSEFRTFGGGRTSTSNPITAALADEPLQFVVGVDVQDVVNRVLELGREIQDAK